MGKRGNRGVKRGGGVWEEEEGGGGGNGGDAEGREEGGVGREGRRG